MCRSISKIINELILSPEAASQSCALFFYYSALNEVVFIHVAEAPVSNSHEKVSPPALTISLGLISSPLKFLIKMFIAQRDGNCA
jgi:hypothetical protein